MEFVSLLETLLETTERNSVILINETLENVITCMQVMQTKVHLLQPQSQLLNDEIRDLKN
jgi:hypothetical protein